MSSISHKAWVHDLPEPKVEKGKVMLAHGGGGQLTDELIAQLILPRLGNQELGELLDAADVSVIAADVALTIDSYVVQPLFFPGGDIGRLAVAGTVNDLAVTGAQPLAIALSLIIAEGFEKQMLADVLDSISAAAMEADVRVVTGDTKVVPAKAADGLFITTAGIGRRNGRRLHPKHIQPGDRILINGPIADHGLAVMLAREMPHVQSNLRSDVAPLNGLIRELLEHVPDVVFMRDPTRGGLASVAADIASRSTFNVTLDEQAIPLRPETWHAAEMLGLDPLEVANEGKVVVVVREGSADKALQIMRSHRLGAEAAIIGQVGATRAGICDIATDLGGRRVLQKPYGEQLPRIC
jgi:hydrogenase expression/formation protein HypE